MPPRRTRNSTDSSLPLVSSTASATYSASSTAGQRLSTSSATVSPELLASVIQAIQGPISSIVQNSLSAAFSPPAPFVPSQGLPANVALPESSLAHRTSQLSQFGLHHSWSSGHNVASVGSHPGNSQPAVSCAPSPTASSQASSSTVTGTSSLVVPPFVPLLSSTSLPLSAPCSSTFPSLSATVNPAFVTRPVASYASVPLLAMAALQQPFVIGPGYSPVPFKVVSQITAGKFVNLEELLAENIPVSEPEPQLWFEGRLVLSHTPKKPRRQISDITSWMEAFSIFFLILCSTFPHRWRDLTSYKLLILRTYRQFSGFCWLNYDRAFREHAAAVKLTDWSSMNVQLFNYHTAGAQVRSRLSFSNSSASQAEATGNTFRKIVCHSWNAGRCIALTPQCRFRHVCSNCSGEHRATSCSSPAPQAARPHSPDLDEPKRRKRH